MSTGEAMTDCALLLARCATLMRWRHVLGGAGPRCLDPSDHLDCFTAATWAQSCAFWSQWDSIWSRYRGYPARLRGRIL